MVFRTQDHSVHTTLLWVLLQLPWHLARAKSAAQVACGACGARRPSDALTWSMNVLMGAVALCPNVFVSGPHHWVNLMLYSLGRGQAKPWGGRGGRKTAGLAAVREHSRGKRAQGSRDANHCGKHPLTAATGGTAPSRS